MRFINSCFLCSPFRRSEKLLCLVFCMGSLSATVAVSAADSWVETMEAQCETGKAVQCLELGTAYLRGEFDGHKVKADNAKAQHWIKKGSRQGEQNCRSNIREDCYAMGLAYFEGRIINTDIPRGLEFMQKACDLQYEKACVWLHDSGITYKIQ